MPENLQKLAGELGGTKSTPEQEPIKTPDVEEGGEVNEPTPSQGKQPVAEGETNLPDSQDSKGDKPDADSKDDSSVEKSLEQEKANRAFAELRAKATKYERAITKYAQMHGVSEEEALERMQSDALNKEAEEKKVDPELLKRLQQSEEELQTLRYERQEQHLKQEFEAVKDTFDLSDQEAVKFAQDLMNKGINIFETKNVDLVTLYRGLNHDNILNKKLKEEKQNWISGQAEADAAPGVSTAKGRGADPASKKIETVADLNAALDSLKSS